MEGQMKGTGAPDRPAIPAILIEATTKAIKAGMKPDELARMVEQTQKKEEGSETSSVKKKDSKHERFRRRRQVDDEENEPERTYRNFDERRMGFLVIGDQHRFGGTGKESYIFASAPPLDYSFCMINKIEEIVSENEQPQKTRNSKFPEKTSDERYRTSSIRLSYNVINSLDGFVNVLYKILDGGPLGLCWLDLSFNAIAKLDEDALSQLPNIKILYLHGNSIADMIEITKLQALKQMKTLTLHGNPIEQEDGYRIFVLYYHPDLTHLDFIGVTKSDKANANIFGSKFDAIWEKRHGEFEANTQNLKNAGEFSYTDANYTPNCFHTHQIENLTVDQSCILISGHMTYKIKISQKVEIVSTFHKIFVICVSATNIRISKCKQTKMANVLNI